MSNPPLPAEPLPPLDPFVGRALASIQQQTLVRLVLSGPTPEAGPVERVVGRLIDLRGEPALSLASREPKGETTRNLPIPELDAWLRTELGPRFRNALLETTAGDWQLSLPLARPPRLVQHRPRQSTPPSRTHDQARVRTLGSDASDWLQALGLTRPDGQPLPSRSDKVRQIDRYAEILGHLVTDAAWPAGAPIRVVDMGCGRGSLTFAAWQLLRRQLRHAATVTGIDTREDLVAGANAIARRLNLEGLAFTSGTIADATLDAPDALIALHACNTATDDAIRRGIEAGCRLIVVAPCCHQQIRPQLNPQEPFVGPLRHGLLAERLAEWLTDALRAMVLEWAGYRVKAIEFVASEHTPKNLLLTGTRATVPFADRALRDRIVELKSRFGITQHPLDLFLDR